MTAYNYANLDPNRREHFVYRAFNAKGQLLYVGCTMDLKRRYKEHSSPTYPSRWWHAAVRFRLSGPYNYETGRRLEREAIHGESPIWNHNEPRRFRINALRTRVTNRSFAQGYEATGTTEGAYAASDAADHVIPEPGYDRPLTDLDVMRAERAWRNFAAERATA